MDMLVEEKIYHKIVVYDYQAVCFPNLNSDSAGNVLDAVSNFFEATKKCLIPPFFFFSQPFKLMLWIGKWILAKFIWMMAEFGLVYSEYVTAYAYMPEEKGKPIIIARVETFSFPYYSLNI